MGSGNVRDGNGPHLRCTGDLTLPVGSGDVGEDGLVSVKVGESTVGNRRIFDHDQRERHGDHQRRITIRSPNAGSTGVSGAVVLILG